MEKLRGEIASTERHNNMVLAHECFFLQLATQQRTCLSSDICLYKTLVEFLGHSN